MSNGWAWGCARKWTPRPQTCGTPRAHTLIEPDSRDAPPAKWGRFKVGHSRGFRRRSRKPATSISSRCRTDSPGAEVAHESEPLPVGATDAPLARLVPAAQLAADSLGRPSARVDRELRAPEARDDDLGAARLHASAGPVRPVEAPGPARQRRPVGRDCAGPERGRSVRSDASSEFAERQLPLR